MAARNATRSRCAPGPRLTAGALLATLTAGLLLALGVLADQPATSTLTIEGPEMAGISGFREFWDRPVVVAQDGAIIVRDYGPNGRGPVADWTTGKPGAPVFDAIHRSLLVRFPDAAERTAATLQDGRSIGKVELVIPFVDTELFPLGYDPPPGLSFLGDQWVRTQPRWHVIAWALRKPWVADSRIGPTFNAYINGAGYWARFGAQNEQRDRHPQPFGPVEVSHQAPEGRIDVTAVLHEPAFGRTLVERLRKLADQGFLLRKWETHDMRYHLGGQEWGTATGGRGIRVSAPKLVVTFGPRPAGSGARFAALPPRADVTRLAEDLRGDRRRGGQPTAVMPDARQIEALIRRFAFQPPPGTPDWQSAHVRQLHELGGGVGFPDTPAAYLKWVDAHLGKPYRRWEGWNASDLVSTYLLYADAMPEPLREHWRRLWAAWLQPGRPYWELEHNQWGLWSKPEESYYARTGDWRGNSSFYRESYTRYISTMNFNHTAAIGALLGGAIVGDAEALRDGRYGLEHFPLRLWAWYDGTTQESIDHYYFGLSLSGQKVFADFGPTRLDRMMGESILTKSIEELASAYHPGLRHFIAPSVRTGIAYLLAVNEGVQHILHTLSPSGTLHDLDNPDLHGMPVLGIDLPPGRVAGLHLRSPWAPAWMARIVDDKPLPYEGTVAFKQWGHHRERPLWKRSYLGKHYGLATLDVSAGNESVPLMAQWRRAPGQVQRIQELGTLLLRFGINRTEFLDSIFHGTRDRNPNGVVGTQGGTTAALQHRGKVVALASPVPRLAHAGGRPLPERITSLQTSVALLDFQPTPTWKVYVDGRLVGATPFRAKLSSRITIHDGVTFIAIIPVPSSDLGRTEEIVIRDGGPPVELQGGGLAAPALVIDNYNFHNPDAPLDPATVDWRRVDRAYGGFVLEVADVSEYPDFVAFQQHIRDAKLDLRWEETDGVLHLVYASGDDRIELGYRPEYEGSWDRHVPTDRAFPYRRVNGGWPYLPAGIDRDTTLSRQGATGRLEKNGATLTHEPGRMAYLVTEPVEGTYAFYNPLPDPQSMSMATPEGLRVEADGKLGLTRLIANPRANAISIDYAVRNDQVGDDMARSLFVFGLQGSPRVTRNGRRTTDPRRVRLAGEIAAVIPLSDDGPRLSDARLAERFARATLARKNAIQPASQAELLYEAGQEHYLLSEPRSGVYEFQRLWPGPTAFRATVPQGIDVTADGRLALMRLLVSPATGRIEVDYPPYAQRNIEERATTLLVFGLAKPPSVLLHGKPYAGRVERVTLDGRAGFAMPLFGADPRDALQGIDDRYARAQRLLRSDPR